MVKRFEYLAAEAALGREPGVGASLDLTGPYCACSCAGPLRRAAPSSPYGRRHEPGDEAGQPLASLVRTGQPHRVRSSTKVRRVGMHDHHVRPWLPSGKRESDRGRRR